MALGDDVQRGDRRKDALSGHGKHRQMPAQAWAIGALPPTEVQVYFDGDATFNLHLNPPGGSGFNIWTTEEGLRAVVDCCNAAIVRARIEGEKLDAAEAAALAAVA